LLETVREFALEHLDAAGETEDRRLRHARHYAAFVAAAGQGLRGPEEPEWADRVAAALDNLRAASAWAVASRDASLALALFAPLAPLSLAEATTFEVFKWVDAALALPDAPDAADFWPAMTWRYQRCMHLFEWDQIPDLRDWARSLPGAEDQPEVHVLDGHYFQGVEANPAAAAAAHERAAVLYAARGDDYDAIRNHSISLVYAGALGVDDRLQAAMEANVEHARRAPSPIIKAQGIGFVVAGQPNFLLADPARALQLLDEAAPWAARSRNPFMAKAVAGARVLALALLGDPAALPTARDAIEVSRNRLQVGLQAGVLSVALGLLGHHREAAELVGAASAATTVYNTYRRTELVRQAWEATHAALGDAEYEAAFARGAARSHEELIDWLRNVLDHLAARGS
jgi:hypothetical protein